MKNKIFSILVIVLFHFNLLAQDNLVKADKANTSFPIDRYTPFGYLDNPKHSFVLNRSGAIKSVPPLGFGFWCRQLPWPYGEGAKRNVNYLSIIDLGIYQDGTKFITPEDFKENGVELISEYHTKNVMSYNWQFKGLKYDIKYFHPDEDALVSIVTIENATPIIKKITLHATNTYGYQESRWWGSDGVTSNYNQKVDAGVSKIWASGDVFSLGANVKSVSYKATASEGEMHEWMNKNDVSSNPGAISRFPDPVYTVLSYTIEVPAMSSASITLALNRGKNEVSVIRNQEEIIKNARVLLQRKQDEDNNFYRIVPLLSGDWPAEWRRGWIYHWETLRMNIKEPMGIYKHHWDAMQPFSPRAVLGETAIDAMCMSYADVNLAKDMLLGIFADAVAQNIPCSREDGGMNMIAADGRECGTTPIWGMPFLVIRSIYERDKDNKWLNEIYPYLKNYLDWWLKNRTDKDGWFHAANSWESGQDGSKRFLIPDHDPGSAADFVRTVDIEAAMAHAMLTMKYFAEITGEKEDAEYWEKKVGKRIQNTRDMFVNGWFRDFDARNNQPIVLKDYYDIMMFLPASLNIATPKQMTDLTPMFYHFRDNPIHFMEWPSFLFPFTEAAYNAGLKIFNAIEIAKIGNRIYPHYDERNVQPILIKSFEKMLPEKYSYRIPGVSDEFWPISKTNPGGCENYGWGATFQTLVIRNIIGFRESADENGFWLSPTLPDNLVKENMVLGIRNLNFRGSRLDIHYALKKNDKIEAQLKISSEFPCTVKILNNKDKVVLSSNEDSKDHNLKFLIKNGEVYRVVFN